uniref:type I polyketide synthase n=1 Tax=Streptomyces sp. NRRL F-5630 TaxID=1463864 RepID=UPI003EBE09AC
MRAADGRDSALAIIGVSCRFAGAENPDAFWRLLASGGSGVGEVPPGRWTGAAAEHTPRIGGYLERVDTFDASFFGISPREAPFVDPQQRLALELGWEALEDARITPDRVRGTRLGTFVGVTGDDYAQLLSPHAGTLATQHALTGVQRGVLANRLAAFLGARGPSITVDSAQSSSLVALHLAVASLRAGESDAALVCGVNLHLLPQSVLLAARLGALSTRGGCFTFDERADGYVPGEGGGAVVLKRLDTALADGDRILCLVRGSATNNDPGGATLTAPTAEAQSEVLTSAYRNAGVRPGAVRYVELHGTGTPTGDPVEAAALGEALGRHRPAERPLAVGSVKTNIGHLSGAAGIAGLIKVVLSLKHRWLPASLNFDNPNPRIPLDELNLRVQRDPGLWPDGPAEPEGEGGELVAGVSSFGMGGTNCHVVLSDWAPPAASAAPTASAAPARALTDVPWLLSGRTDAALRDAASRLAGGGAADGTKVSAAEVAWSLASTRKGFERRAAVVAATHEELLSGVRGLAEGDPMSGVVLSGPTTRGEVGVVFSGAAPESAGAAMALSVFPVFAEALAEVCEVFDEVAAEVADTLGLPERARVARGPAEGRFGAALRQAMTSAASDTEPGPGEGGRDQAGAFAFGVASWRLLTSWGLRPTTVAGHGVGEVTAAHAAGVWSLRDAARLALARGWLGETSPADGADACRRVLSTAEPGVSRLTVVSTMLGGTAEPGLLQDPEHWLRQARETAPFTDGAALLRDGDLSLVVEAGRDAALTSSAASNDDDVPPAFVPLIAEGRVSVRSLATLWVAGADVDWAPVLGGVRSVDLPTYPFQRRRYWLDTGPEQSTPQVVTTTPSPAATEAPVAAEAPAAAQTPVATGTATAPAVDPAHPGREAIAALGGLTGAKRTAALRTFVCEQAAVVMRDSAPVDPARSFKDLGFDSVMIEELGRILAACTGLPVRGSTVFDHPTPQALAAHLDASLTTVPGATDPSRKPATGLAARSAAPGVTGPDARAGHPGRTAHTALPDDGTSGPAPAQETRPRHPDDDAVAVVGMACRYPGGVASPDDLWRLVADGAAPPSAWPTDRGWTPPVTDDGQAALSGGFLNGAADFDADFFGISPREALTMDPQQRLLLETSWEALEQAGLNPDGLRGSATGVYVGATPHDYGPRADQAPDHLAGQILTGSTPSVISGRVSYTFGFEGPAVTVDTACSSSLVATHLAGRALRSGECDLALAGGVAVMATTGMFREFGRQGGLAADGRCKPFSADADGTAWSEGVGVLVLERLSDARRNGHRVLAVVRGSAINQDGASNGLSAPSGPAQQRVIRAALADAGLGASDVDVVEAHGTGTRLGDPIEAEALLATYGQGRGPERPLWLGSVKSNVGHTQAAAGVAGVIKMVEALRHGALPASLHAERPSPHVDWASGGVRLLARAQEWSGAGRVRRAGVSSFGISGTNAHLILEEAPAEAEPVCSREVPSVVPWVLSARGADALRGQAERLAAFVDARPDVSAADVGLSLAGGRAVHGHRAVVAGASREELLDGVRAVARGEGDSGVTRVAADVARTVFVFPGQGSQWVGMALELLGDVPAFAERLGECAAALEPFMDVPLLEALGDGAALERVEVVQPALWAVMVSLARVWEWFGVRPAAVVGHSQGEIAAAVVAGALSLEDGARVVALRSRAIAEELAGRGGMVAVQRPLTEVEGLLAAYDGELTVAAVNGPGSTVVSGGTAALDDLMARCESRGIRARRIPVDYASHSAHVDAVADRILADLAPIRAGRAKVPFFSTVTGDWLGDDVPDAAYWVRNLRHRVRFEEAVRELAADGFDAFVECSAHPVLAGNMTHILEETGRDAVVTASLLLGDGGLRRLLTSLSTVFTHGGSVDWTRLYTGTGARHVALPTYAFQRERYWLDPVTGGGAPDVASAGLTPARHPLLGAVLRTAGDGGLVLTGRLTPHSHRWLHDHAVGALPLLPGTALLELAVHAGVHNGTPHLDELTLHEPLPLPTGSGATDLQVTVTADGPDRATATVHSRAATDGRQDARDAHLPWTHHATAALRTAAPAPAPAPLDWAATWPPPGTTETDLTGLYDELADEGYVYGPAFQLLARLWKAPDDTVYAEARLPEHDAAAPDDEDFALHPALLDAVLHAVITTTRSEDGVRLPYAFHDVAVTAPGARALRARITPSGDSTVALDLAAPSGQRAASIGSLMLLPADLARLTTSRETTPRSLFAVEWEPLTLPGEARPTGQWAFLGDDEAPVLAALRNAGAAPEAHRDLDGLRAALDAGAAAPDILVWAVGDGPGTVDDRRRDATVTAAHAHAATALATARALLLDDRLAGTRLLAVTEGAAGPAPVTDIAAATVWGLLRSAHTETPGRFLLADTDREPASLRLLPAVAAGDEPQVALRAGQAHVPRLARVTDRAEDSAVPFGPDSTVLLTGATGHIGRLIARRLVREHGVRRLVLVSRRGGEATRDLTAELAGDGCEVTTLGCDPADHDALRSALADHALTAVVHAAGVLDDGTVTSLTPDQLATVLRPKVDAAWNLHDLTRDEPLTAFVLLSSVSGVLGGAGQANYAAANAFLDALAAHRAGLGLPGQSQAWGLWDQDDHSGGMASGLGTTDRARLARLGVAPLPEAQALALFDRAVADPAPLTVPTRLDLRQVREQAESEGIPALLRGLVRPPRPAGGDGTFTERLTALSSDERLDLALRLVRDLASAVLGHASADRVPVTRAFREFGFDSLSALELRNRLNNATGLRLPAGLVFDHPTPTELAAHLVDQLVGAVPREEPAAPTAPTDEPLAIVGMACRYPGGVTSPEELWELVATGGDGIGRFPADRGWDLDGLHHPDPDHTGTSYTREGGFLYDAGDFDAGFFGISPREALAMDPQQRLLLETSWEALEQAGLDADGLHGSRTGVFAGQVYHDYAPAPDQTPGHVEGLLMTGSAGSVLSGRVAYTFGFEGPAVTVDTACSSSLVAIHLAGRALRSGECDLALAGGVTVMATPAPFVQFSRQRGLAADGRCKPFSADADGIGMSEGAGVLVLERLSDARRNGHRVLAVVRGSAINQDGASNGLTAPNGPAQQRVIRAALADAGLGTSDVDVVEAHGTGTRLGDPIEAEALLATYGQGRGPERPLWLGSVKSNVGHTQAAAGVAGVIKMVEALRHGALPASLHAEQSSPHVDWASGGVRLLARAQEWSGAERVRRAGVSSFGISGTNAHLILEEAPVETGSGAERRVEPPVVPWVITGHHREALRAQAGRLAAFVEAHPDTSATEIGAALATGRAVRGHRAVVAGASREELLDAVRAVARGEGDAGSAARAGDDAAQIVFVFPGQGSQWVGMARELLAEVPVFAERLGECAAALGPFMDVPLLEALGDGAALERVEVVQPALWAVMVSLARVWEWFGVRPAAVVGHSQGEIAAAVVAGALSLEDGARVVALRSRAIAAELAGHGGMASVAASEKDVRALLDGITEPVTVAAVNGPATTVVSGTLAGLDALRTRCEREGVRYRRVPVDYASHSGQVDALADRILADLAPIRARRAQVPFFSTVIGDWLGDDVPDAAYWVRNLRRPVRFQEAVRALAATGTGAFVECSAHPVLTAAVEDTLQEAGHEAAVTGTLRRDDGGTRRLFASFGEAFAQGAPVAWARAFAAADAAHVDLPTYAFQRERYWWEPATPHGPAAAQDTARPGDDTGFWEAVRSDDTETLAGLLDVDGDALARVLPALRTWRRHRTERAAVDSWRYHVRWAPTALPAAPVLTGTWLLAIPADAVSAAGCAETVAAAVRDHGGDVTTLTVAADATRDDIAELLPEGTFSGVLSLLSVVDSHSDTEERVERTGLTTTAALFQALGEAENRGPLWCLTHDAITATAQDARTVRDRAAAQQMVWGFGRIAALEHPERFGGLVDLPARPVGPTGRLLAAVLAGDSGEDQVALRPSGALVRRLSRAGASGTRPGWRPRGTVLVTGGTGGLGARVARHLAGQGAEHLLLVSRRGPDAPGAAALRTELEESGVGVTLSSCDVGDRAALAELLATVPAERPLTAVVHTAAVLDDSVVDGLTPDRIDQVLRVKADGARHLHELTRDADLDAFVLFSSLAGTLGASGQGNYAPGNAYLDALAEQRHALGLPATSIAWSIWDERGMATEGDIEATAGRHGLPVMDPDLAASALVAVAGDTEPTVVIADVEWDRFHVAFTATRPSPFLSDLPEVRQLTTETAGPAPDAAPGADGLAARVAALGDRAEQQAALLSLVREQAAKVLGHSRPEAVNPTTAYRDLGFDSVTAVELRNRLNKATGLRLPSTLVFDHPTARDLAAHLRDELLGGRDTAPAPVASPGPAPAPADDDRIAIVGMGCRFPGGVRSPQQLWQLLRDGRDAITPFPDDRGWDLETLRGTGSGERTGTSTAQEGGFLHDAGDFDAEFFGISPREALAMDPQQRLLLETSWEALEQAGIDPTALRGTRAAVFTGTNGGDYLAISPDVPEETAGYVATGNTGSVLSGRVAYTLGLEGPALTVDTACSASLVALHLAVRSLRQGESDLALAGGVTVMSTPGIFTEFTRQGGLAPDGRSKAFGAGADGAGFAEGVGVLVVERLSDARRHGHQVLAVVRGSAVNQDGASNGLSAPSGPAQQRVIRAALADAGLDGSDVDAVEAHGTGTKLGDPIEAGALLATYGQGRDPERPLWLGSVKSNIGHTQAAAGVAGVIKTVLALRHGTLPPTLHAEEPSAHVDWSSGAVALLTAPRDWPETGRPRRAGVSSFGVSGTNAHVILEQGPEIDPQDDDHRPDGTFTPWTLSARSDAALREQARRLLPLAREGTARSGDIGHTLATARAVLDHRAVVLGADGSGLADALTDLAEGRQTPDIVRGTATPSDDRVVFVFPGQGSQWVGMARELLADVPVFAERLGECAAALEPFMDVSLLEALGEGAALERVEVVQPALWAVMVSLARVWEWFGVRPAAVVGHSQGEIAAAVVAGALSLEDGARVVALRSRAIAAELAGLGGMVAVTQPVAEVEEILAAYDGELTVAAVNSPATTVVSGGTEALDGLLAQCEKRGIRARRVPVDYASHCAQVETIRAQVEKAMADVVPRPTRIPFFSTVTGGELAHTELDGAYWYRNLRSTVRFEETVRALLDAGFRRFVEASAHPALTTGVQITAEDHGTDVTVTGTLRRDDGGRPRLVRSLAEAFVTGVPVRWARSYEGRPVRRVELPTYAFQHKRYWVADGGAAGRRSAPHQDGAEATGHALLGRAVPLPGTGGALFTGRLSLRDSPWLRDHAVHGRVLVPGTALLDMVLRAAHAVGCDRVEELILETPLLLDASRPTQVQVLVAGPAEDGSRTVDLHARVQAPASEDPASQDTEWVRHARATLVNDAGHPEATGSGNWPPADAQPVDITGLYERLHERGFTYGDQFRGLTQVWRGPHGELFADVRLPEADVTGFGIHPALLDAALHAWPACADDEAIGRLPFLWTGVTLHATGATRLRATLVPTAEGACSVQVTDSAGLPVLSADGLLTRPLDEARLPAPPEDGVAAAYRVAWTRVPASDQKDEASWVAVLGDTAEGLPGTDSEHAGYADLEALEAHLTDGEEPSAPGHVLVDLRTDASPGADENMAEAAESLALRALELVQRWLASERFSESRLVLITGGAVQVHGAERMDHLAAAPVWGLVRSAQTEHPGRFVLLDVLDRTDATPGTVLRALATGEAQLAVRGDDILAPRLVRGEEPPTPEHRPSPAGERAESVPAGERAEPVPAHDEDLAGERRLAHAGNGTLEGIVWGPSPENEGGDGKGRRTLGEHEVRIAIRAVGLNFRDVLIPLGMYPDAENARMGSEGAGVVTGTGPGVTGVAVGDRVMGVWQDGFRSSVVVDERVVVAIPEEWSFVEAASVPVAFVTAFYALV